MNRIAIAGAFTAALLLATPWGVSAQGQGQAQPGGQAQQQKQEPIFGSQLMTREERAAYRSKMRAARTPEERAQLRSEHHDQMVARAKDRGVTLPAEPPAGRPRGPAASGMGGGMGGGMGPGSGTGPRAGQPPG
ncbi:MAG TPA: hypothetical protein VD995_15250 [Azospirillum sp.]|nr:hypothetical protein [Azospirillum sp.]